MHPDTMRLIDRWIGIPLCFFASLWPWEKSQAGSTPQFATDQPSPETIVFICVAEIGALVVAFPAIQEARKKHPHSRVCFITAPAGFQTLEFMGFEEEDIYLLETSSVQSLLKGLLKIRNQFNKAEKVSAVILEPFARFSTLLSVWIGASQRIGCYRFLNEGVYLGNFLTHRLVYNSHLHVSQTYLALVKA